MSIPRAQEEQSQVGLLMPPAVQDSWHRLAGESAPLAVSSYCEVPMSTLVTGLE